jgi:hypothetical protein
MTGLDFFLDPAMIDARASPHVREVLRSAIATLESKAKS